MSPPRKPMHPLLAVGIFLAVPFIVMELFPFDYLIPPAAVVEFGYRFGFWGVAVICGGVGVAVGVALMIPSWILVKRCIVRYDRYHRWKKNQCVECGYDHRAHRPGEKCPECGTTICAKSATIGRPALRTHGRDRKTTRL